MHTQARMRAICSQALLKSARSSNGSEYLAPRRTYCYESVKASLEEILNRSDNIKLCEEWRTRDIVHGQLCDVYDGQVWNMMGFLFFRHHITIS